MMLMSVKLLQGIPAVPCKWSTNQRLARKRTTQCICKNTVIPPRSIFVGNPGKVVKQVSDEMLEWKTEGTKLYMELPKQCQDTLKEVEPLKELEPNRPEHIGTYQTHK